MSSDKLHALVRHQRAVVALGLNLASGFGIEGERFVVVLVGVRPDVPVLETLPRRPWWNELAALVARREVPLADITRAVSRAAECFTDGHLIGPQLESVVDDSRLIWPASRQQHGPVRRAHRVI